MSEENKQPQHKQKLKSRLFQGDFPAKLDVSDVIAAQKEIAKLPYGNLNPKAKEIAKKYGLNHVPSL